jgi:hypothetical protein
MSAALELFKGVSTVLSQELNPVPMPLMDQVKEKSGRGIRYLSDGCGFHCGSDYSIQRMQAFNPH